MRQQANRVSLPCIMALFLILPLSLRAANVEKSLVIIEVTDSLGVALEKVHIELRELGTQKDFSNRFKNHEGRVPYGVYSLRTGLGGFKIQERVIRVLQPIVHVRVGLPLGLPSVKILKLSGTLSGCESMKGELWLKAIPLGTNDSLIDGRLSTDGAFELTGLYPGRYLVLIYHEDSWEKPVRFHSQIVKLLRDTHLNIDLASTAICVDQGR